MLLSALVLSRDRPSPAHKTPIHSSNLSDWRCRTISMKGELSASRLDFYHKQVKTTRRKLTLRRNMRASH
jgi:hypothetical protein